MTPDRIAEIKARAAKATSGPWCTHPIDDTCVVGPGYDICTTCPENEAEREDGYNVEYERMEADADFIAHARQDIPDLIAALEAAQERVMVLEYLQSESKALMASAVEEFDKFKDEILKRIRS